ncbi:Rv3654c family TadE-like protein [Nocardia sp. NPDC052566]|uniref:Rv3654c family TadE-like protein n=1 Tax=Nocardia sp. NPDC052566 TaxID=3364330 RepID=UPI0037CB5CDB
MLVRLLGAVLGRAVRERGADAVNGWWVQVRGWWLRYSFGGSGAAAVRREGFGRGDRGAASVFAALALAGLVGVTALIGQVGVGVVARHRAQAAADLGALAGAGALAGGAEAGCAAAGEVVRRMKFRMEGCEVHGWDVFIAVAGKIPMGLFGDRTVRSVAGAGPVEESDATIGNR